MNVVIVSSFDTFQERIELLKEYYESKGNKVTVVLSNYKHFEKRFVTKKGNDYIYVETKPYYKNISVKRLASHHAYAKDAFKEIEKLSPDLLHVIIPANSLAKQASKYKQKHPNVKLYLDINDLWPESMPIGNLKNKFPFTIWKNTRDKFLNNSDIIFVECDLYKEVLEIGNDPRVHTLLWAKKDNGLVSTPKLSGEYIQFCYLGSINNIINIDAIVKLCSDTIKNKPVRFQIIGDGEKKIELIEELEKIGVTVIDNNVIYDQVEKQRIFDECHYGINIMKEEVCVGLTMKSLDYFQGSLPIINTIKSDTFKLVTQWNIGFNYSNSTVDDLLGISIEDNLMQRNNVKEMYRSLFDKEAFMKKMDEVEG